MLAHRESKNIALGTAGKLTILEKLLEQHYPDRTLIFTNDNATVYKISHDFLIPAITHQTPVKERHQILEKFRSGDYSVIVVSHVLNEGVDVPDARIAVLLSGSGSTREYVQRLGRVLRKGTSGKMALLYEVVAEQTSEEGVSRRRRQESGTRSKERSGNAPKQLSLVPDRNKNRAKPYKVEQPFEKTLPIAAEESAPWPEE